MNFRHIYTFIIISVFFAWPAYSSEVTNNYFTEGDFEAGLEGLEVYRFPKYSDYAFTVRPIFIDDESPISGRKSLYLPALSQGGYKLESRVMMLRPQHDYNFFIKVKSSGKGTVRAEFIQGQRKLSVKRVKIDKGSRFLDFSFSPVNEKAHVDDVPVRFVIWLSSLSEISVDDISVSGGNGGKPLTKKLGITTSSPLSVFGLNEIGHAMISGDEKSLHTIDMVRIRNIITGEVLSSKKLSSDRAVILLTSNRGAFGVELWSKDIILAKHSYVVIDKSVESNTSASRYGVSMEEHGQRMLGNAKLENYEFYELAQAIGAGNVRLFTPAMPDIVSKDGHSYDFTALDATLLLSKKFHLEPLLELGSNLPQRIPPWLRSDEDTEYTFDLREGLLTKKLKDRFSRSKGGMYFDLVAYKSYLTELFTHIDGKVVNYEVWNEPGHKFTTDSYLRIAELTYDVAKITQSDVNLIGFTSTKGKGLSVDAINSGRPSFLQEMINKKADKFINTLSYHSEHAFRFFGKSFDHRNEENGYPALIRDILDESTYGKNFDIWDTERGIPWSSPGLDRADRHSGFSPAFSYDKSYDFLEVSRRLPGIFSASIASDIKKIFWFYMDSTTASISKVHHRFGFFDAKLEPMPHIAVYDAFTSIIGDASFVEMHETDNASRIYLFKRDKNIVGMLYNWKELTEKVSFSSAPNNIKILDIMGNLLADAITSEGGSNTVNVDGWPKYIIFENTASADVKFLQ